MIISIYISINVLRSFLRGGFRKEAMDRLRAKHRAHSKHESLPCKTIYVQVIQEQRTSTASTFAPLAQIQSRKHRAEVGTVADVFPPVHLSDLSLNPITAKQILFGGSLIACSCLALNLSVFLGTENVKQLPTSKHY